MDRGAIREALRESFNESELRDLCFDLDVDYDSLPGEGLGDKCRELVAYVERHNRRYDLLRILYEERPDIAWRHLMQEALKKDQRITREIQALPEMGRTGPLKKQNEQMVLMLWRFNRRLDRLQWFVLGVLVVALLAVVGVAAMLVGKL